MGRGGAGAGRNDAPPQGLGVINIAYFFLMMWFLTGFLSPGSQSAAPGAGAGHGGAASGLRRTYSLQHGDPFVVRRSTVMPGIVPNVAYYVERGFANSYGRDARFLWQIERLVQEDHRDGLARVCSLERDETRRAVDDAKRAKDEAALNRAMSRPSAACDRFEEFVGEMRRLSAS